MATDSLFGGSTDLTTTVSAASLALINQFLTDTVGGSNITGAIGDSTVMLGSGHDGEKQGAVLPGNAVVSGSIDDGVLKLDISLPANLGFVFEGKDNATPEGVGQFLSGVIDSYLPPGASDNLRSSLNAAVNDLVNTIRDLGVSQIVVRVIDFVFDSSTPQSSLRALGANEILFNASASTGEQLFAINLAHLQQGSTLVLQGVENAVLSGAGSVRIEGNQGARITSDTADQAIVGGGGNDTLIGGGGHDTLTGGTGDDVFAFARLGHFEITDFSAGDQIAFNVAGVSNVSQLLPLVTSVHESGANVTFHFGADASITLVGLSAAEVTADMIKFTF